METEHTSIEFVRAHREAFVGASGVLDPRDWVGMLVSDGLCMGCESVQVERIWDWYIVVFDQDWLTADPRVSLRECFLRVKAFPQRRENACRSTLTVTAFSECVVTIGAEGLTKIVDFENTARAKQLAHIEKTYSSCVRVVAFCGVVNSPP